MFQGLSLDQAPPYRIPLYFYFSAAVYLVLFGLFYAIYGSEIEYRYSYESIALTHTLTLGFITLVMVGSLFQMLPVMLGLPYKNVVKNAKIIFSLLNIGTVAFLYGFFYTNEIAMNIAGAGLFLALGYFSVISLQTVIKSVEKDFLVNTFATAFFLLFLGAFFGFLTLLGHLGYLDSTLFSVLHMGFILFGWIFMLISAVSYKIIPMFFVAKEFPSWMKNFLYILVTGLLGSFLFLAFIQNQMYQLFVYSLSSFVVIFAAFSMAILYRRKRARKDISISLWYFAMINFMIAFLLYFFNGYTQKDLDIFIGIVMLFGGVVMLIHAMLYKIIPFLTWFHLSSAMVFDAQMHEVISKQSIKRQVQLLVGSYIFFLLSGFLPPFSVVGGVLLILSGVLLIKNIHGAIVYYDEYIKKAPSFDMEISAKE